jgi:hypothetical protein
MHSKDVLDELLRRWLGYFLDLIALGGDKYADRRYAGGGGGLNYKGNTTCRSLLIMKRLFIIYS